MEKKKDLKQILDLLDEQGIDQATFVAHTFDEEYDLPCDDKDYVTFYKGDALPWIVELLMVCDHEVKENVYKDWNMAINYHA